MLADVENGERTCVALVLVPVDVAVDADVAVDVDDEVEEVEVVAVVVAVAVEVAVAVDVVVAVAVVVGVALGAGGVGSGAVILPAAKPIPPTTIAPSKSSTGLVPRFGITISSSSTATAGAGLTDFGGRSDAAFGGFFGSSRMISGGTTDCAFGETMSSETSMSLFVSS